MHNSARKNVLVIGLSREEFGETRSLLDRSQLQIDRFPTAAGALALIAQVPFSLLVIRHPLDAHYLEPFLAEVRRAGSPCRGASVLLLADKSALADALGYVGRGANRALPLDASGADLQTAVSDLLAIAPRKAARFTARLEARVGDGPRDVVFCQTANVSESGMLIHTDRAYDLGTRVRFEFRLPEDRRPSAGIAEVVRHADRSRESLIGLGVRFVSFEGDSKQRFERYLTRL